MIQILMISLSLAREMFTASDSNCNLSYIGDGFCDHDCMLPLTSYDCGVKPKSRDFLDIFYLSDCFLECFKDKSLCTKDFLINNDCDEACNSAACGWDAGNCGYCASGCYLGNLTNDISDPQCNTSACRFDNNRYGWCAPGCFLEDLSSTIFKQACNVSACDYHNGLGLPEDCSPGCNLFELENDYCDDACDNALCNYDNQKCLCAPGCTPEVLATNTCEKDDPCMNPMCNYKQWKCGKCAAGCLDKDLGNGVCDSACNVLECNYDYGDCSCAPGCLSRFNGTHWDHVNGCDPNCMTQSCFFNYQSCKDSVIIAAAVLTSFITKLYDHFDFSICQCSYDELRAFSSSNLCESKSKCDTNECLNCNGLSGKVNGVENCLRFVAGKCVIEKNKEYLHESVITSHNPYFDSLVDTVEDINLIFSNSVKIYFIKQGAYRRSNPILLNVADKGLGLGDALALSIFPYCKISIPEGTFDLAPFALPYPYASVPISPLVKLYSSSYELTIEGAGVDKTLIIFYYPLTLNGRYNYTNIKHLTFTGHKLLNPMCEVETCYYCRYYYQIGEDYLTDRLEFISGKEMKENNFRCMPHTSYIIFDFDSNIYIEDVTFINFRDQFQHLIKSNKNITIVDSSFIQIQPSISTSVIYLVCDSSCQYVTLNLTNVLVTDLNSGYEYRDDIRLGGFIKFSTAWAIYLNNVTFTYNMATGCSTCSPTSLIDIQNVEREISITNSKFQNNYLNNLIKINAASVYYSTNTLDKYHKIIEYATESIVISNCVFSNIYTSDSVIDYSGGNIIQNILIKDCNFSNLAAFGNGVLTIVSAVDPDNSEALGNVLGKALNIRQTAFIVPRVANLENIYFGNISLSASLMTFKKMANFLFNNIVIENIKNSTIDALFQLAIVPFILAKKYLSAMPSQTEINPAECTSMFFLETYYKSEFQNIFVSNISCTSYSTSVIVLNKFTISNISTTKINLVSSWSLLGLGMNIYQGVLSIFQSINISNTKAMTNTILIDKVLNVYIVDLNIKNSTVAYFSGLNINLPSLIHIQGFSCTDCIATDGKSAALLVTMGQDLQHFFFSEGFFERCNNTKGQVAAFYLDSMSSGESFESEISNIKINDCIAIESIIYFSRNVNFKSASISNLSITNSLTKTLGIISDYHQNGMLHISNYYSANNKGYHSGIVGFYTLGSYILQISNAQMINDTSIDSSFNFLSISEEQTVVLSNITVNNILSTIVSTDLVNIIGYSLNFNLITNSFSIKNATLSISGSSFSNIASNSIYLSDSFFAGVDCTFSTANDTFIYVLQESFLNISNSIFEKSNSTACSVLALSNSFNGISYFTNCTIKNNNSTKEGVFVIDTSHLFLTNCKVFNNTSSASAYTVSQLYFGTFVSINSEFIGHKGTHITASIASSIYLKNSVFTSSTDFLTKAGFDLVYADPYKNSKIASSIISNIGGVIYALDSRLEIESSRFYYNSAASGSIFFLQNCESYIKDSVFMYFITGNPNSGAIEQKLSSKLIIKNSTFSNSLVFSSAIRLTYSSYAELSFLTFSNINSLQGSGLSIEDSLNVQILNSTFINSTAQTSGGAIYSKNANLNITDSRIINNTAANGGGIWYSSPDSGIYNFTINGLTYIVNNSCSGTGGGINWSDKKPKLADSVIIQNNSAYYGGDFAAYPVTIGSFKNKRALSENSSIEYVAELTNLAPGGVFNGELILCLLDSYGNAVTNDNSSTIDLSGTNENITASINIKFTAVNGCFNITGFKASGIPGSTNYFRLSTATIDLSKKNTSGDTVPYQNNVLVKVKFRNCTYGEEIQKYSCESCPETKYLIEPQFNCKACPSGASCKGGYSILPLPDYWRLDNVSEILYACSVAGACLGSQNGTDYIGECAQGYTGHLCSTCVTGYSLASNGMCSKCPNSSMNVLILFGLLAGLSIFSTIMIQSTLKSAFAPKSLHSIYIKIFTNYLQIILITTQFNLNWPSYVIKLFSIQKSAAGAPDQIFSLDCYMTTDDAADASEALYYNKIILSSALPLIVWAISITVWVFISFYKENNSYLKRELFTTMIVLFILVHPNIVKTIFGSFSCREIHSIGYWLIDNLQVKCWNEKHIKYILIFSLPCIVLWVIGVPLVVLIILLKKKKFLKKDHYRVVFGFLFNGYKTSKFYWEFVILYRKILMISVLVFFSTVVTLVQALTIICVLLVSLYLQYSNSPYKTKKMNFMELEALITSTITLYCGVYYMSNGIGEYVSNMLFVLIILGNLYFILYWAYYMTQAIVDILANYSPWLRRILKKGDGFDVDYFEEKLSKPGVYFDKDTGEKGFTLLPTISNRKPRTKIREVKNMDGVFKAVAVSQVLAK